MRWGWRLVECAVGFFVTALGVALYLNAGLGPGPAEGPALAMDPPFPFKWFDRGCRSLRR